MFKPFPRRVAIENTNACNAKCISCPREKLTRKIEIMSLDNFTKTLDDCVDAGAQKLTLHNFGEPTLDKALPEKIKYAKQRGIKETFMVTNASLVTPELADSIISAGLDRLKISFQGITKQEYESFHVGLNFEQTIQNIELLLQAKLKYKSDKPKMVIRYMGAKWNDFFMFWNYWRKKRPKLSIIPGRFHNFTNGRTFNSITNVKRPEFLKSCRYLRRSVLYILVNGDVAPCCYDFNGVLNMGNAFEQNIAEVWNGEKYQELRRAHEEHKFPPLCKTCDKLNLIFC